MTVLHNAINLSHDFKFVNHHAFCIANGGGAIVAV
jgi:hypothetical protein